MSDGDRLDRMAANLASLNDLVAELAAGIGDPEFAEVARRVLRDHSLSLGCAFQGEVTGHPDAAWRRLYPEGEGG